LPRREAQLTYSDIQPLMHDETGRRRKARKIISVVQHALGRTDLANLLVLDLGCSTGFIADELRRAGGLVIGVDIDVSGLAAANARHPDGVAWVSADGVALPFADESVDLVVFNQIYEHVVDPDAVMVEIRRVLADKGIVYLGFGNRLTIVEPHVRLPFASWLPPGLADRYVRVTGRADRYHERLRARPGLRKLARELHVLDYTWTAVAEPARFGAEDVVRGPLRRVPWRALRLLAPFVPTYLWVGSRTRLDPAGHPCISPPRRVTTPRAG
jgi:SAM-dependent methyltransferase